MFNAYSLIKGIQIFLHDQLKVLIIELRQLLGLDCLLISKIRTVLHGWLELLTSKLVQLLACKL